MLREVRVQTQYGDLVGEVSCDEHQAAGIESLDKDGVVPEEYFPLAASIYYETGLQVSIYACKKDKYGETVPKIVEKARDEGQIEVKTFDVEIEPEDIVPLIHRLNVLVRYRLIDIPLVTEDAL